MTKQTTIVVIGALRVKSVHLLLFSNTKASRLMKLHTHICHDAPYPLPSTVTDLYLLFGLGRIMLSVHLALFLEQHQQSRQPASVAQLDAPSDWRPGGRGFNPRRGRQHSFVEIDHEIFSTVILSLPLIQEGQLSVSGERMCTILVNRLED